MLHKFLEQFILDPLNVSQAFGKIREIIFEEHFFSFNSFGGNSQMTVFSTKGYQGDLKRNPQFLSIQVLFENWASWTQSKKLFYYSFFHPTLFSCTLFFFFLLENIICSDYIYDLNAFLRLYNLKTSKIQQIAWKDSMSL